MDNEVGMKGAGTEKGIFLGVCAGGELGLGLGACMGSESVLLLGYGSRRVLRDICIVAVERMSSVPSAYIESPWLQQP